MGSVLLERQGVCVISVNLSEASIPDLVDLQWSEYADPRVQLLRQARSGLAPFVWDVDRGDHLPLPTLEKLDGTFIRRKLFGYVPESRLHPHSLHDLTPDQGCIKTEASHYLTWDPPSTGPI